MPRRLCLSGCGLAVWLASSAHADPIVLAQVEDVEALSLVELLERPVVAASRYAQRPGGSPTLVSSIDAEQIEQLGYRTIGEALRSMRGVYLSDDRNYVHLGVRGFGVPGDYNARIVERHHGTLDFDSSPGNGTTFHISLPVHAPPGVAA